MNDKEMNDKEMNDKEMNIEEEKWIKTFIKIYIRTNTIPPEYWMDRIEKRYGVTRNKFCLLCADIKSVL